MSTYDVVVFEAVVENFVAQTLLEMTDFFVTNDEYVALTAVKVTNQVLGPTYLDVTFVVAGTVSYRAVAAASSGHSTTNSSVSYEQVVMSGFATDFVTFVEQLRVSSAFFSGLYFQSTVDKNDDIDDTTAAAGGLVGGDNGDGNDDDRGFAEGGLTVSELMVVLGLFVGVLTVSAVLYHKDRLCRTGSSSSRSSSSSPGDHGDDHDVEEGQGLQILYSADNVVVVDELNMNEVLLANNMGGVHNPKSFDVDVS